MQLIAKEMLRPSWKGVPTLPYGRQLIEPEDIAAVVEVLASERLTQGPVVPEFERLLCETTGASEAVAVNSGTAALHLLLLALGIGPGKRVLTSANTFLASATAALHCGAEVEFCDIDLATGNLDLDQLEQRLERGGIDAVVAVHFAGLPCDMQRLLTLKRRHGFLLIEDACHALGASWSENGRDYHPGAHPDVEGAVLSFHPVKHVTTAEGGAILTPSLELATRMRRLREHGLDRSTRKLPFSGSSERPSWFAAMEELGYNYRLNELSAALGLAQLGRLGSLLAERRRLVTRYLSKLEEFPSPPGAADLERHAWHLYVLRVDESERDALMEHLATRGIQTQLHYYPVPMQPWFVRRYGSPQVPNALEHALTSLSLPLYPGLRDHDQDRVLRTLTAWKGR